MRRKIYYKIVEHKGDNIYTLFHGINGTRKLERDIWITGVNKPNVQDGKGTRYTSGIHVVDGLDEAKSYMKRFRKKDRIIVRCYATGLRKKEHSKSAVYLANKVKILK